VAVIVPVQPSSVKFNLRSERMFKTRLTEAARGAPNFAGKLRSAVWGCGSNCAAGAFIDLETGIVYAQPLAKGTRGWERWMIPDEMFEGAGMYGRPDSRLLIVRCGKRWLDKEELLVPDTYYFVWEGDRFRRLMKITADRMDLPANAVPLS
jgi:hypothetical protein